MSEKNIPPIEKKTVPKKTQAAKSREHKVDLSFIDTPKGMADKATIAFIEKAFSEANAKASREPEGSNIVTAHEVIVYDTDETNITNIDKQLRASGMLGTRGYIDISAALARIRTGQVSGVFVWCGGGTMLYSALFIQEILEQRDINHIYIVLVAPGSDAIAKFKEKYPHLLFDGIVFRGEQKGIVYTRLMEIWANIHTEQKAMKLLYKLRESRRDARLHIQTASLSADELSEISMSLMAFEKYELWLAIEMHARAFNESKTDEAKLYLNQIEKNSHLSLNTIFELAKQKKLSLGSEKAAHWLHKEATEHRLYNIEKAMLTLRYLLNWKSIEDAVQLMKEWKERPDMSKGALFSYGMAKLHFDLGRSEEGEDFLKDAIYKDPLSIDLVVALADFYEKSGKFDFALLVWEILDNAVLVSDFNFRIRYVECLLAAKRVREAKLLVEKYIQSGFIGPIFEGLLTKISTLSKVA